MMMMMMMMMMMSLLQMRFCFIEGMALTTHHRLIFPNPMLDSKAARDK